MLSRALSAEQQVPWMLQLCAREQVTCRPSWEGWTYVFSGKQVLLGVPANLLTGDSLERVSGPRLEKQLYSTIYSSGLQSGLLEGWGWSSAVFEN